MIGIHRRLPSGFITACYFESHPQIVMFSPQKFVLLPHGGNEQGRFSLIYFPQMVYFPGACYPQINLYVKDEIYLVGGRMISANNLEQLIQALNDESMDSEDRRNAAEVFGKIIDPRALDPLIQYFKDPAQYNPNQLSLVHTFDELLRSRSAAEEALVMIGEPAIQPLIQVLDDEDYRLSDAASALNDNVSFIRRGAVRALGRINGAQVIRPLIQALGDNDSGVQSEAEDQLRKIIFEKGLDSNLGDSLIQALKDSDNEVQMRAEEFLGRFLAQSGLQKEQSKKIQLRYW